ncbi:hypothetical protein JAAARDRAFT_202719 [Jaapia argillacea MUCL 33604]|uniref:PhoX domain-containing protein n=1 Tax=Jaapia argillacea MUCL 33604 TaxID=933084 RepID=A0A067Q862_9AGAM|nr:hypothetical protein JAAARDRAFT_202719 [Jaapia argillacea MUCL 33604]
MQPLSLQIVVGVAVASFVLPLVARLVSSPLTLLLLSPFIVLLVATSVLVLNVVLAYYLDKSTPPARHNLSRTARPFAFSSPAAWQAVLTRSQWAHRPPQSHSPLYPDSPLVSSALNDILIMIVRDFVLTWYRDISASPSFPTAVSSTLHSSVERLLGKATTIDLPALVVKRILPMITSHVEQYRQSEVALRGATLERRLTQSEELDLLLAGRYAGRKGDKLHLAVNNLSSTFTRQSEEMHLRNLVDKALPYILPEKEGRSKAVRIVVREIVACSVLYPIMDMLSDPDFWNKTIDQIAGEAIRQQRLVSKVRNVLEAQSPRAAPRLGTAGSSPSETINIRTDTRHFESFLRSINRCSSLLDARRLKNDIVREIRRTRTLLANHEKDDWINGEKTEDVVAFLDRLYTAKRKVEQRIVILGGEDDPRQSTYHDNTSSSRVTLRDVLTNPSSLSYFMEFMDRRNRPLLVQFWLTVESFKNPLESVDSGSSDGENDPGPDISQSATAREDISMVHDLYFAGPSPPPSLASISQKHVNAIRSFVRDESNPSPAAERKARRSVMLAQRQVEREMEQDFDEFQRSELWFRVVGDIESSRMESSEQISSLAQEIRPRHSSRTPSETSAHYEARRPESASRLPYSILRQESAPVPAFSSNPTSSQPPPAPKPPLSTLDVLMSPVLDQTPDTSRAPLFDDPDDNQSTSHEDTQLERMEAIQAALTDIIAYEDEQSDKPRSVASADALSQVGRVGEDRKRRVIFEDDVDVDDEERAEEAAEHSHGSFHLAGPGDLQLSYEIARLGEKVGNLQSQDSMLDTLIKKAELTGDTQELRLLRTSKSSLNRELRELIFQKVQYEQQDTVNRLIADRTKVAIVNATTGEEGGKSVVRYVIEVQQLASDGTFTSGWVVARRYNEFLNMHNKLKERYLLVRSLEFPGKRLVTALSSSFVDTRRSSLEKYLQGLVSISAVCESEELRAFLSRDSPFVASELRTTTAKGSVFPARDLVRTMYHSVAESIDDMFFGPSMLDVMIQRLTRQAAEFAGIVGSGVNDEDLVAQALKASGKSTTEDTLMQLSGDLKPLEGETSTSSFSAPICDLLLAIFELDKKNNWLRRQAIVIILQQVLGGTIERKIYDTARSFFDESHLLSYISMFRDGLWPGGQLKAPSIPRTTEEKVRTRDDANRKLSALIPDLAANMIGRSNARRGARRMFAVLQNRRLNQHIAYTILDEVFAALFPETLQEPSAA